jgi:uracil-DNA glycosylase family 4
VAEEVLGAQEALALVLADVRRYLGWHRDVAGDVLQGGIEGAHPLLGPAPLPNVEVTVAGASTAPTVVAWAELEAASSEIEGASPNLARGQPAVRVAMDAAPSLERRSSPVPDGPPRLDEVRRALGDCKRCKLCSGRKNIVFGVGNPKARLVFVGEGPGAEEDSQGIPFVGAAGQLLTKMIQAMGFSRDEVYICNVVKCRPPGNRNPEPEEIEACQPFLEAQLRAIKPEVIVALGKFAAQTLLKTQTPITRLRGKWREYLGITLMPTFHPAYLLRNPAEKKAAWADLQAVMARFGKSPARE